MKSIHLALAFIPLATMALAETPVLKVLTYDSFAVFIDGLWAYFYVEQAINVSRHDYPVIGGCVVSLK